MMETQTKRLKCAKLISFVKMKTNYFKNGYQVKMQSTEDALDFHAN
jgi:hypothetical protein